jgi:hypothetical protein
MLQQRCLLLAWNSRCFIHVVCRAPFQCAGIPPLLLQVFVKPGTVHSCMLSSDTCGCMQCCW